MYCTEQMSGNLLLTISGGYQGTLGDTGVDDRLLVDKLEETF